MTGTDGFGFVAHHDATSGSLRVVHCLDFLCSTSEKFVVDGSPRVGWYSSLAINPAATGGGGRPLIAYYDDNLDDLRVLHCETLGCEHGYYEVIDGLTEGTSSPPNADGIGRHGEHAKGVPQVLAKNGGKAEAGNMGSFATMVVNPADNKAVVAYAEISGINIDLRVAHLQTCTSFPSASPTLRPSVSPTAALTVSPSVTPTAASTPTASPTTSRPTQWDLLGDDTHVFSEISQSVASSDF